MAITSQEKQVGMQREESPAQIKGGRSGRKVGASELLLSGPQDPLDSVRSGVNREQADPACSVNPGALKSL